MRYRFKGVELKTENAAKSYRQVGAWLCEQIALVSSDALVLDYGCGKFRYTIPLSRMVRSVFAVDSRHQIDREQRIAGKQTTLGEYAKKNLKNVFVCDVRSTAWRRKEFDFILCSNVLSTIPHKVDRLNVLRKLRAVLKDGGRVLVSTQYRNTHFNQWKSNPNAIRVRDGWFVTGRRGPSFYAIIPPKKLARLCREAGFSSSHVGSSGETAFVFAER